jgi:hypothetical protein
MEDPCIEPVVIHPQKVRRRPTEAGNNNTELGSAGINTLGSEDAQEKLIDVDSKTSSGSHDVQTEMVPVEKKDHLGTISTTWVISLQSNIMQRFFLYEIEDPTLIIPLVL